MDRRRSKTIIGSFIFIMLIVIYNMFSIFIEHFIDGFGMMILFLAVAFLVGVIIFSIIKIGIDKEYHFVVSILASLISLYLIFTQAFRFVGIKIDFNINKAERLKVVEMLKNGDIIYSPSAKYIRLPEKYSYLSRFDGQVMIDETNSYKVCFFVDGGLYRRHDVVIYIFNDDNLVNGDFGENIRNIKKITEHWFCGKITE